MDKKVLTLTQKELLRMKREKINEAVALTRQREFEFSLTVNQIASEHGIDETDYSSWKLSKNDASLDFAPPKKKPEPTIPGKKSRR